MYFCLSGMKAHFGSPSWNRRESCFTMSTMVTEAPAPSTDSMWSANSSIVVSGATSFMPSGLAGVGDDDELVGADELLVQLGVGDVVRVVGEEQRRARRHVADLEAPAEERTDRCRARSVSQTPAQRRQPLLAAIVHSVSFR